MSEKKWWMYFRTCKILSPDKRERVGLITDDMLEFLPHVIQVKPDEILELVCIVEADDQEKALDIICDIVCPDCGRNKIQCASFTNTMLSKLKEMIPSLDEIVGGVPPTEEKKPKVNVSPSTSRMSEDEIEELYKKLKKENLH